jgi:uncharacterized protein
MLRLDLARLGREGTLGVDIRVPADDPMWHGLEVKFAGPVAIRVKASYAGSGEVVVRGSVEAELVQACRRCLEPVPGALREELTLVFAPEDADSAEDDGDVRPFREDAAALDLTDPVREELVLAIEPYVVCDPDCRGLCPRCGANRNTETCSCTVEENDPRWDVLRALKEE